MYYCYSCSNTFDYPSEVTDPNSPDFDKDCCPYCGSTGITKQSDDKSDTVCPECKGLKIIHIPAVPGVHKRYDMDCPTCEGEGELPDREQFPNNCPACGEPIAANEEWCEMHKEAAKFVEENHAG